MRDLTCPTNSAGAGGAALHEQLQAGIVRDFTVPCLRPISHSREVSYRAGYDSAATGTGDTEVPSGAGSGAQGHTVHSLDEFPCRGF